MGRSMATVYWEAKLLKDGSKRYYVRSKVRDVRRSHGSCRTLSEARTLRGNILKSIADGSYWETPKEPVSLHDFYLQWIKSKSKNVKPGTLTDYELTFRLHILPTLGDKSLSRITPGDVQTWVNSLSDKGLSPSSVNKAYRYFRNCVNNAVDTDIIDRSPCRGIMVPPAFQQVELDILSLDEVSRVLDASQEPDKTLFSVLAFSGLRLGEGLGLKWRDIDFENQCIRVERAYGRYGWSTPKTKSSRRAVPISQTLAAILREYQAVCDGSTPEGVVFSHDGTAPLDPSNVRRDFNSALEDAGVRHVSLNSLRHFYASNMIASGCSIKFLQNSLGHSTATLTLNTYSHLIPESGGESVTRFDALISGKVTSISEKKSR